MSELVQESLGSFVGSDGNHQVCGWQPCEEWRRTPSQDISDVDWGEASDQTVEEPLYKALWGPGVTWFKSEHPDWLRAKFPP